MCNQGKRPADRVMGASNRAGREESEPVARQREQDCMLATQREEMSVVQGGRRVWERYRCGCVSVSSAEFTGGCFTLGYFLRL